MPRIHGKPGLVNADDADRRVELKSPEAIEANADMAKAESYEADRLA